MKTQIREIVKKHIELAVKLEKTDDIQENINNGYYAQKKYEYIDQDIEKNIKADIEEFINETSEPREYQDRLKKSNKIYVEVRSEFIRKKYNSENWLEDFLNENDIEIDSEIGKSFSQLMFEIEPDRWNLVSCADDIMLVVNAVKNSK